MFKKVLAFSLLMSLLAFSACTDDKEDEPDPAPPATTAGAKTSPDVTYVQGFYDQEGSGADSWRWMSSQGVARLKNSGKDMKLNLVMDVPMGNFKVTPNLKVSLNGEVLETFASKATVEKEYSVPATKLGSAPTAELVISADQFFVPRLINPKLGDDRQMSLSVRKLTWQVN
jgi:hypothetical protein